MPREESQAALREALVDAGHIIPLRTPGLYAFTQTYEDVLAGVERLVRADAGGSGRAAPELAIPPLLPEPDFVRTGYVRSFPQLIGSIDVFTGSPRDHRALLVDLEGENPERDWTEHLVPARMDLISAPCHGSYALLTGLSLAQARYFGISSRCWRHEPSADPMRLVSFRMRERVCIGTPRDALEHREAAIAAGSAMLAMLELPISVDVANDPFFGRTAQLFSEGQRDAQLKFEFVCDVYPGYPGTAIGSVNYHQDHFGTDFGITGPDGQTAHSSCIGFGLERVTNALFAVHGMDPSMWPSGVRTSLGVTR